nr:N-acetylmuramoyl-L-alanine amidase [uncultured Catonella sp.]
MKFKKIITFVSILGMLSCTFPGVSYADSINIKYGNKKINYSDKQVKYTINGSEIKSKYPGIIISGISLASAKEVFSDSKIGLSYKFNVKSNTLELKRDGKTLLLKLNSEKAKVNGKSEIVPIAPRIVQFSDKTSKVYVPARYVAKTFGLTYDWDAVSGIASMTGKTVNKKKTKKAADKKTAPKDKNTNNAKKENFSYNGKTYDIKGKKVIFSIDKTKLNNSKLPGVYVGKTLMAPAKSIFLSDSVEGSYSFKKSNKNINIGFDDNSLTMKLGSKIADYNGTQIKLDKAPNYVKLNFSNKNEIYVPIENICELFDIEIETSGVVSTLSLPEEDTEIEDIADEEDDNTKDNNSDTTNQNPQVQKPSESFVASQLPFTWKPVINDKINNLIVSQNLTGNNNAGTSSIADITNVTGNQTDPFDTYIITSTEGFNGIRGNLVNNQLTVSLDNMTSNSGQNYAANIRTVNYLNTAYNTASNSTDVNFGLVDGVIGYDMSLSNDNKAITVKIYKNTITEISGSYSNGAYTFTLTGLAPLTVQENSNSDSNLNLSIPNIIDTIGSGSYVDNTGNKLTLFSYFTNGVTGANISINKSSKLTYYTRKTGNSVSIILSETPTTANVDGAIISLPSGIDETEIENEDNYFSNNFTITLPGDLRNHFNTNPVKYDTNKVTNVTITLNDEENTVLTFYTTTLYAYKLKVSKSQIKVAIDRAKKLYSKVVVIDPGHGGHDSGTTSLNKIYKEKNIVLSIGYTYFRNYLNDEDLKVYWTRKDDTFMTLYDRAAFAKKVDADLFVSIHMNSAGKNTKPKGTEVYYSTRNNILQPNGLSSYTMASMFLKNITSELNMANRGVKSNIFVVTNMNTVPAVLIEYGFLTNSSDLDKFSKLEVQDKSAEILYNTIEEIFDNYPTDR